MKDNIDYKKIGKGLYKISFSLCILVLCVITVVITGNYEKTATTDLKLKESQTSALPRDISVVHSNIAEEQLNENPPDEDVDVTENIENETQEYIPEFIMPVDGDVLKDFSNSIPLYSKTMDDWRIHMGTDILCPYGTEVVSCEMGTVTDIGYDILFGNYVEVTLNDYILRYTSLESGITHKIGDEIKRGEVIGIISDSCISEICDEPHLHFEMKKSGEYVNPMDYIY